MKSSDDLFELIKSLNKNEKRYIRLHSSTLEGSKMYLRLFDTLDKVKSFDEKLFRKQNSQEKFIKHYSFNKHYLYGLIIKCLAAYNSEKSVDAKIHSMIMQCKILFDKTLYNQYFRSIEKAKKYALKHERFGYFLHILDMEKIIIRKEEIQGLKSEELYNEANSALNNLDDIFKLSRLAASALHIFRTHGILRDENQAGTISGLLNDPILNKDPESFCSKSREAFYRVHEIISDIKADYPGKISSQLNRYKQVTTNPYPFKDYIINYDKDILVAVIDSLLGLGRADEAEEYFKIYKGLFVKNKSDLDDLEITSAIIDYRINTKKGDLDRIKKIIPVFQNILVKYKNKMLIDTELTLRYNIVKYYIAAGEFNKALTWANALMAHPLLNKRADYESYLRILNLIIHFELKNYELLKYLLVSTYRFLYRRKKLFRLEMLVLDFIRRLPEIKNNDDLTFNFRLFQKRLAELKNDNYEKNAFEYFDFLGWVNTKTNSPE